MRDAKRMPFQHLTTPRIMRRIIAFLSRFDRYCLLVFMSIFTYAIVFSYFTCLKHYAFSSYAWDLGIFNQAFYTTVFHGKLFYYTIEKYVNVEGSYFAIHFSPILFVLVPFYAISPRPETLLILQSCILALGALPLYLIMKGISKDERLSFLVSLAYLLYPPLHGANWFDFHPQAFYPLLIFFSYHFFIKRRWILYVFFTLLTLMVMEWSVFMVIILSANLLLVELRLAHFKNLKKNISLLPTKHLLMGGERFALILSIVLSFSWWLLASYVHSLFPLDPSFLSSIRAIQNWEILFGTEKGDFQPLLQIPTFILLNPQRAFNALFFDYHVKFLYVMFLLAPLLFIPLRSKLSFSFVVLLLPFLLSNYRGYYVVGSQYPLHILPFVFLAFVHGLSNGKKLGRSLMIATLLFTISTSPLSPMSYSFVNEAGLLWYSNPLGIDERVKAIHGIIDLIPANASVLATNSLFPHVSSRLNAYAISSWIWHCNPDMMAKYLSCLINESDYVLLRCSELGAEGIYILNKVSNDPSFGLYAVSEEIFLFKRGYEGEVLDLITYPRIFLACQDFVLGKEAIKISEQAVFYPKIAGGGTVIFGPYKVLPPGSYKVTFTLKVAEMTDCYVAKLDVAGNKGKDIIAVRYIYDFELEPGRWNNVSLTFYSTRLLTDAEFRVFSSGLADLYIHRVIIERLPTTNRSWMRTFNYMDLSWRGNATVHRGLLLHSCSSVDNVFWYGPYINLPPGNYKVSFFIKVVPSPEEGDRILILDVVSGLRRESDATLAEVEVDKARMKSLGFNWYEVIIPFSSKVELAEVEFRGLNPSPKYDIYLAYILVKGDSG